MVIKIPTIKKLKIKVDPDATPQEVGDVMSKGLHLMHRFEDEMNGNPFGSKLIKIGKPMMLHGLHNACDMMEPEVIHHMCHHHPHGGNGCKCMVNNIIKGIILFLIWKIFESIDNRCCGMCESECLKKFKNDLNEVYGKISKVNSLLNESTLALNEDHKIATKIKGLEAIRKILSETDNPLQDKDTDKNNKSKLKKYIKIGTATGLFGFSAKLIYNMYTRWLFYENNIEKFSFLPYGIVSDNFAEEVEKLYYLANNKTPEGIMFKVNVFFNNIVHKFDWIYNDTSALYKIHHKLKNFIFKKTNWIISFSRQYVFSNTAAVTIIGVILVALIIALYYLAKFIYKKIKNRRIKTVSIKEGYIDDIKRQTKDFWNAKPNSGIPGTVNAMFNMYDFERINKFLDDEFARTKNPEYMEIKTMIDNYRSAMRGRNLAFGLGVGKRLIGKYGGQK